MAELDDDTFTFGNFKFAPSPPPQQPQPHINGVTSTSKNDIVWGNFFAQSQFNLPNNGVSSSLAKSSNWAQPTSGPSPIRADPGSGRSPKPKGAIPLSLFGEVDDEEESNGDNSNVNINGWFDPNSSSQNGKIGFDKNNGSGLKFGGVGPDLNVDSNNNNSNNNDEDEDEDEDDEWEFKGAVSGNGVVEEQNLKEQGGFVVSGSEVEHLAMMDQEKQAGQDAFSSVDHKPASISFTPQSSDFFAVPYGNGANQCSSGMDVSFKSSTNTTNGITWDPFSRAEDIGNGNGISASPINKNGTGDSRQSSVMDVGLKSTTSTTNGLVWDPFPGGVDIGNRSGVNASLINEDGNGDNHQPSTMNGGLKSATSTTNSVMWDPFSVVEDIGNGSGISASSVNGDEEFDDFGDFIDASQEVMSNEQEQVVGHTNSAEAQLSNGEVQEKQNQTEHSRGALPLSLFSDDTEESSNCLDLSNEVVHMPTLSPGNSFNGQGSVSIHDLISNLYSEAQCTSVDSAGKPAENEMHSPLKATVTTPLHGDDSSWEFKGAISDNAVGEQSSPVIPGNMAQKQPEILSEVQSYTDFYDQLRESLCILLSCQLDELKKARSSDTVTGNGGIEEALDDEIQEAFKLLEESVMSTEVFSQKGHERYSCLNKLLEVLQEPKFNVIESDFSLSKRLQLAANEWKVAAELLRHAISVLKIISLGSADEQCIYASTWFKIINVCVQELRYGVSIWKRASEKNVQHQILSDSRGQHYIQALAEIYKVVELLELSAKVYKPWILLHGSHTSQIFRALDECDALWSNSGLEEAVLSLSDNVNFGCSETAKALLATIKYMREIDIFSMHERVFIQHKAICRLSLLPQEMLADLKTVMWDEKAYYLNLANLWANLISRDPPQLPLMQVS